MEPTKNNFPKKNAVLLFGSLVFFILLFFSLYFYKERILFIDLAYHSFKIIQHQSFEIQTDRHGAFLTQLLPIAAVRLSLPLQYILMLYSASFVIIPYIFFSITLVVFKNKTNALLILLFCVLQQHSFFWPQSELQQGIIYFIFITGFKQFAILTNNKIAIFLVYVLALLCLFFHPLLFLVFIFYGIYKFFEENKFDRLVIYLIFGFFIKQLLIPPSQYDNVALVKIFNVFNTSPFTQKLNIYYDVSNWFNNGYYFYTLLFVLNLLLLYKVNKKAFITTLVITLAYIYCQIISYKDGAPQFYFENLMLPILLFNLLMLSIVKTILENKKSIAVICCLSVFFIFVSNKPYTNRLQWHKDFIGNNTTTKSILVDKNLDKNKLIMTWGLPYELLLFQALQEKKIKHSVIILENINDTSKFSGIKNQFLGNWFNIPYESLNKNYFSISDTSKYMIQKR